MEKNIKFGDSKRSVLGMLPHLGQLLLAVLSVEKISMYLTADFINDGLQGNTLDFILGFHLVISPFLFAIRGENRGLRQSLPARQFVRC